MIDSYIILNRKTNFIIKIFLYNICFLIILVIWWINTTNYQTFFHIHSQIQNLNSTFYMEVLIPVKEVKKITNQDKIVIDSKGYTYRVAKIEENIIYKNNINYQKLYLEIYHLDLTYQINGYHLEVKIPKENKK